MASKFKILYQEIANKLKTDIPALKTIRLFNNQFNNESRENAFAYPCAFIEFRRIEWQSLQRNYQTGGITISIHIGFEEYKTEETAIFDLIHDVFNSLQGFQTTDFTSLNRTGDVQDANHDNVIVWRTDFELMLPDQIDPIGKTQTTINTLEIQKDLDIDNQVIRTGDGNY